MIEKLRLEQMGSAFDSPRHGNDVVRAKELMAVILGLGAAINQLVEVVNEQQRQLDALRRTLTKEDALRFDYTTDPTPTSNNLSDLLRRS